MDPHIWPSKKPDDQHEHTFSNYVRIRDVVQKSWKTARNEWEKWRERGQGYPCYQHDLVMMIYIYISSLGEGKL